jgi:hypothetical protein
MEEEKEKESKNQTLRENELAAAPMPRKENKKCLLKDKCKQKKAKSSQVSQVSHGSKTLAQKESIQSMSLIHPTPRKPDD